MWKPSSEDCRIIRACAEKSAGKKRVKIEPGERYHRTIDVIVPREGRFNIWLLTSNEEWGEDTDLNTTGEWDDFRKGVLLASGGRALIDFYVYGVGCDSELETNVQAFVENGKLVRVTGTSDGTMWEAPI